MKFVTENQSNFLRQLALPLALLAMMTILNVSVVRAADGDLDTSFDGDGKQTNSTISGYDAPILRQPDGKIVAAGVSIGTTTSNFRLIRYNANGAVDTTFGANGIVTPMLTTTKARTVSRCSRTAKLSPPEQADKEQTSRAL